MDLASPIFPGLHRCWFLRSSHTHAAGSILPGSRELLGCFTGSRQRLSMDHNSVLRSVDRHTPCHGVDDLLAGKPSSPAKLAPTARIDQVDRHVLGECFCLL